MLIKTIFAIVSLVISVVFFIPYCVGIWKKETKPHLLTWVSWFILTGIGFFLSYSSGGGIGSFIFALTSIFCLLIAIIALIQREKNITKADWIIFAFAILIIIFYTVTKDALISAILATSADCLSYIPTFRKSYLQPQQEPSISYAFGAVSMIFSIAALEVYSVTTLIYPLSLVIIDSSFVLFSRIRKKKLEQQKIKKHEYKLEQN